MLRVASSSWQVVGEWALVAHERRPQGDASTGNGGGVVLQRPDEAAGPCTIQVVLLSSGGAAQQAAAPHLRLRSNARTVEVSVQRPGDSSWSYVHTQRATQQQGCWQCDITPRAGCSSLQLKLLSLQGARDRCCVQQLCLVPTVASEDDQQLAVRAATSSRDSSGVGALQQPQGQEQQQLQLQPQQPPGHLSQVDQLRLLIQQLQQPSAAAAGPAAGTEGAAAAAAAAGGAGGGGMPDSLRLLLSKAQQPAEPGAAAAMKTLTAHIAHGALFRAAQQRAGGSAQAQQELLQGQQRQQQQQQPQQQQPSQGIGSSGDALLHALASGLERLEAKVDALSSVLLPGLPRMQQAMDALQHRLDALEVLCQRWGSSQPAVTPPA